MYYVNAFNKIKFFIYLIQQQFIEIHMIHIIIYLYLYSIISVRMFIQIIVNQYTKYIYIYIYTMNFMSKLKLADIF